MAKQKKNEEIITSTFEDCFYSSGVENIGYNYFDFHLICKNQKFDKINPYVL
jgi:hypothetical protein